MCLLGTACCRVSNAVRLPIQIDFAVIDSVRHVLRDGSSISRTLAICRHWFAPRAPIEAGKLTPLVAYPTDPERVWPQATITVATAANTSAPADMSVWLTLIGDSGTSSRIPLDSSTAEPAGSTVWFTGAAPAKFLAKIMDIGAILEVEVELDGARQAWNLDWISITCDKGAPSAVHSIS